MITSWRTLGAVSAGVLLTSLLAPLPSGAVGAAGDVTTPATSYTSGRYVVMLKELQGLMPEFRGLEGHVRCFGHILNLVVKVCYSAAFY